MPQPPAYWFGEASVPWWARALAGVYGALIALRSRLYRIGVLRRHRVGAPVIVVGNITAGGTGKTPLTIALVERLRAAGFKPGVASRGYGRSGDAQARWVDAATPPAEGGDEPVLIARNTGTRVRVDRDRVAAAKALVAAGCDVVICDDGLQHYRLQRDVEIEVIDGARRYGNGRMMPAGPLREPVARAAAQGQRIVGLQAHRPFAESRGAVGFRQVDHAEVAVGRARDRFPQRTGRHQTLIAVSARAINHFDFHVALQAIVLQSIVADDDIASCGDQRLRRSDAVAVDAHTGAGLACDEHGLVATIGGWRRRIHPARLPLAATAITAAGHAGLEAGRAQPLHQRDRQRGLAGTAGGDVAHHDDGHADAVPAQQARAVKPMAQCD